MKVEEFSTPNELFELLNFNYELKLFYVFIVRKYIFVPEAKI